MSCIVEGHGEVQALPVLLRRLAAWRNPHAYVDIPLPIRVSRGRFLTRHEEFERHIRLAVGKCEGDGWVLVLLDADDDCPATLGADLLWRAREVTDQPVSIVLANREFEAWYIGAAESLNGMRGLVVGREDLAVDPERPRDAKGWLAERMVGRSYGETTDQPAFAAQMSLPAALDRCRSFRKLCSEWDRQFGLAERGGATGSGSL